MSLTRNLVAYIHQKEITERDLARAATFTLDAIACAYAGRKTPVGAIITDWAKIAGDDAGRKALIMGALTHITETDDLHRASVTHPGCVVVPAVLAVGERIGASGTDILKAILHGFEAMCRIGMGVGPAHYKIWHNTATCGPFGSAMGVASLLNLSEDQTVHALGNAGTQASGLWQFLETGAMSKHLHAGRAAEAGLIAADMAAFDFTGPPEILEGDKAFFKAMCDNPTPDAILSNQNSDWQLLGTSIKPWPSCRHTHPVIDAALEIQKQLNGDTIKAIHIDTYQTAIDVCDEPTPTSDYKAKFSLQHCAAIALLRPAVDLASFGDDARSQSTDLRTKTIVNTADPYARDYPLSWGAKLSVTCSDNTLITATRTHCKGDPELPLSDVEMRDKALSLLQFGGLTDGADIAVCKAVFDLPTSNQTPNILTNFLKTA